MFSLKFYEQNFSEIESQKNGMVSLDRKEAIRNKMMILDKEYAKSRMQSEQSQLDKSDEFSSQYFKMREEPQGLKTMKRRSENTENDLKIDEETRKLNMSVLTKILKMPEDAFQVKSEFMEFKNEIHENLKAWVEQAERIKNIQRDFSNFSRPFDSEENENPPQLAGLEENPEDLMKINLQQLNSKERLKWKKTPGMTPLNKKDGSETSEPPALSSKYNFYQLNKQRWGVNQNNIIEVQKLPKEIDRISMMKTENDSNIMRMIPLNFSEKRKIQAMMDDMKSFITGDDEIHTNSCVCEPLEEELKEANIDIGIPYYLHLSSLSRELISNRKTPDDEIKYDQKVLDFLSEKDYQINQEKLLLEDVFNILSGRISDKILSRLFSGQEIHPLFEDFSEDNLKDIRFPFESHQSIDKRTGSKPKSQKSSISQDLVKMFQKKYSTRYGSSILQKTPTFTSRSLQEIYDEIGYPIDQLQHDIIEMNTIVQNNYVSWQDNDGLNMNRIGGLGLNKIDEEDESIKEKKKKMILGDNKFQAVGVQVDVGNEEKSSSESENEKNDEVEEDEFQGFRIPFKGFKKSVNVLLKEISDLKDAKQNSMNMVNSQVMMKYIAEINMKIEQRLKTLLSLIMDRDIEQQPQLEEIKEENYEKMEDVEVNAHNVNLISGENNTNSMINNRVSEISLLRGSLNPKNLREKNEDELSDGIIEDEGEVKRIKEREKMKEDLKQNLKTVVKDIDKLQGRYIDGHLKTKLLFQFLKEYRKLQEERQQEKMIEMEESEVVNDVDNPFDQNIANAMEKENYMDGSRNSRFKRLESKHSTLKNPKIMKNGWDISRAQKENNAGKKKPNNNLKKKNAKFNPVKQTNWIGGGDFDEKEFADGQKWKIIRK